MSEGISNTAVQSEKEKLSRSEAWDKHFAEVKAFTQVNQRWPSTAPSVADEHEKRIGQWWSRQKYYFNKHETGKKSIGINEKRAEAMRTLIATFGSLERDGVWDMRYHAVHMRIKNHGKLWPYNSSNSEEQKTTRWWSQQKTFYRKFRKGEVYGGMTESRCLKVETILRAMGKEIIPVDPNVGT